MRQQHDILQPQQHFGHLRFGRIDVEPGPGELAGFQRLGQRLVIDDAAARGVDEIAARLHRSDRPGVDQVGRLRPAGNVQRDKIGLAQQVCQLGAEFGTEFLGDGRVCGAAGVIGDLHAEAVMRAPGGGDADAAETDAAQHLAPERAADEMCRAPAAPVSGAQFALAFAGAAGRHQHQGEGDIGCRIGQHARRVGDGNALRPGGGDIDMVEADTVIGDQPDPVAAGDDIRIDPVGNGRAQYVEFAHGRGQFGLAHGPVVLVEDAVELFRQRALDRLWPAPCHQ